MEQDDSTSLDARVAALCARHGGRPDGLIEILHGLKETLGHVPADAVPMLAQGLNISRADVHGVVSFYHDFEAEPGGRTEVRICRAEACQAMGCEELIGHAEQRLGAACGGVSSDGSVALRAVYCLGNCALSPAVQIDGRLHGRVDAARLDTLLAGQRP